MGDNIFVLPLSIGRIAYGGNGRVAPSDLDTLENAHQRALIEMINFE